MITILTGIVGLFIGFFVGAAWHACAVERELKNGATTVSGITYRVTRD